jgi:aminoglycoside 3-N-acetyltransferase
MYAGCPRYYDEVSRGNLTPAQEREILEKLPAFDPNTARAARDHGVLVEFFRTFPGSRVNQHVTRFVVWGRHASFLISRQPWDYALGADSVLERFLTVDGRILLLGADRDTVTFLHHVEHVVDIPNKRIARYQVPVDEQGRRVWRVQEEVDSSGGARLAGSVLCQITDSYLAARGNVGGRVGDAPSHLVPRASCSTSRCRGCAKSRRTRAQPAS